jgi:hypothetical protein
MTDLLTANVLSPIPLAFALGVAAKLARSEFSLPRDVYTGLSIYLLFALGLKGGVELAHTGFAAIALPATATLLLGCLTPVLAYLVLRRLGRFSTADAAGIAAHYGSVSAVTFIAAQQFVAAQGLAVEGFMPTLLTLMESPGIHIALAIGAVQRSRHAAAVTGPAPALVLAPGGTALLGGPGVGALALPGESRAAEPVDDARRGAAALGPPAHGSLRETLHEVLTGRTMVLLVGGLAVGYLMGDAGWRQVAPFFDAPFKGALTLFILEMGVIAAARLGDLRRVGPFLLAFAVVVPSRTARSACSSAAGRGSRWRGARCSARWRRARATSPPRPRCACSSPRPTPRTT